MATSRMLLAPSCILRRRRQFQRFLAPSGASSPSSRDDVDSVVCSRRTSSSSAAPPPPRTTGTTAPNQSPATNADNPPPAKNPDFRPRRIILIRHGQSEGNVDESAYVTTADWRIPLTDLGRRQAKRAGKELREKISEEDASVVFYYSPYLRTRQTLDEIIPLFDNEGGVVSCLEEPRISEQQIGNFQNVRQVLDAKAERSKFGRFFYRFPSGEAGLDVYNRVSSFISTLVRDCNQHALAGKDLDNLNVVIVTHGLALRLMLMRWFQWSVEDFEQSQNPENCELITMNKIKCPDGYAWMELEEKDRVSLDLPDTCGVPRNVLLHRTPDDGEQVD